jgi:putative transposase
LEASSDLTGFEKELNASSDLTGFKNLSGLGEQTNLSGQGKQTYLSGLGKGLHSPDRIISKKFSDFFNSYTKSINTSLKRTGGLFETPFKRIHIDNDAYFSRVLWYIHFNPQKHGFVENFKDYPYSSYHSHLTDKPTKLAREEVIKWFGNDERYSDFHNSFYPEKEMKDYILEFD